MAEGLLKKILLENASEKPYFTNIKVLSSGIYATDGTPPTDEAIKVMQQIGIDISNHRSRRLTKQMVLSADIILVMEVKHIEAVCSISQNALNKTWLLRQSDKKENSLEIPDPLRKPLEVYEECRLMIESALRKLIKKL